MHVVSTDPFQSLESKLVIMLDCVESKRDELGQMSHSAWTEHISSIINDVRTLRSKDKK